MKERGMIFNAEMVRAIHPKMQDWNNSRKISIDDERVKSMFLSGMTAAEIAPHFNCSTYPIKQAMKRLGLHREAKKRPGVGSDCAALREALDAMLNDLNASIRREQTEREKNAKLLARIEELESCKIVRLTGSDITHIMQQEWNEYCDDTGCCPDDFRVDEGTGYLEFDAGTWANKVASRIIRKLPTLTETLRD